MKKLNWLITGGLGFIGRTLVAEIINQNLYKSIRIVDNLSVGTIEDLSNITQAKVIDYNSVISQDDSTGLEVIVQDILNAEVAVSLSQGADVIVHLAANTGVQPSIENPRLDMETNVYGILNYLEAAKINNVPKFVFASSGAPIGLAEPPINEKTPCRPLSPYGASKLAGEAYCSAYHGSYGLKTISLRFSNVYGPLSSRKNSLVAKFIKQALNGQSWTINGDGEQTRDYIYSEDLVKAIIKAAYLEKGGEVFQIATQIETSVNQIKDKIHSILKTRMGTAPDTRYGAGLTGEVRKNYADISYTQDVLKWQPSTKLEEGLAKTVDYFLEKSSS